MQPLTNREFALIAVVLLISVLGFANHLDNPEGLVAADLAAAQASEATRQAEAAEFIAQVRGAYEQGLREGAAGAMAATTAQGGVQAAQACMALGYGPRLVAQQDAQQYSQQSAPRRALQHTQQN